MKKKEMKKLRKEIIDAAHFVVLNPERLEEWLKKIPLEVIVDLKETIENLEFALESIEKRKSNN